MAVGQFVSIHSRKEEYEMRNSIINGEYKDRLEVQPCQSVEQALEDSERTLTDDYEDTELSPNYTLFPMSLEEFKTLSTDEKISHLASHASAFREEKGDYSRESWNAVFGSGYVDTPTGRGKTPFRGTRGRN